MHYRAGHADLTQAAIVAALRAAGRSVVILSGVGAGVPDLLVGWGRAHMLLVEVKSDRKVHRRAKASGGLRATQIAFLATWRGPPVAVVSTATEALAATGVGTPHAVAGR